MARVRSQKAAKDYPEIGVKKGDTYYKWSRKIPSGGGWIGRTFKSATFPKRSQLTSSAFLGQVYDLEDAISAAEGPDDLESIASDIRQLGDEQTEKFDNMPEGLQQGSTGDLLTERAQQCEEWADAVEEAQRNWAEGIDVAGDEKDWPDPDEFTGDCMFPG